jgi:nitrate reductase delta subunit
VAADRVHPLKLASLLLQYPTQEIAAAVADLDLGDVALRKAKDRARIGEFLGWYRPHSLAELQREYVQTFDFARRRALHLTYHLHGDRRQRGLALLRLRQAYVAAGFECSDAELPDYLPLMLEFAALAPEPAGIELLDGQREAIELIRASLRDDGSPYAGLLTLVSDSLPGLTSRQLARIRRAAAEGPPNEEVGLEPFAPPEVMPSPGHEGALPMVGGNQ